MRWIDLHPSANPSELGETEAIQAGDHAEIREAALAMHRSALRATERAHRAAARSWDGTASGSLASTLKDKAAAAHLERADSYHAKGLALDESLASSPRGSAVPTPSDIEAFAAEGDLVPNALPSPRGVVEQALHSAADMPNGEMGISRPSLELRVGLIAGPELEAGFSGIAEISSITSANYLEHLGEIDLLIIGSDTLEPAGPLLDTVLPAFTELSVPTAFFSNSTREDAENTLSIALACDLILAVDHSALATYQEFGPSENAVRATRTPVSPVLHTPVGTRPARTEMVAFYGMDQATASARLPLTEAVHPLFDGVLAAARPAAFLQTEPGTHGCHWMVPKEYAPWTLSVREKQEDAIATQLPVLQRASDVGIAVNAVLDSQTLIDTRVLQLQASGTMVLATYNQGANSYYPHVYIANAAEDVAKTLQYLSVEELRKIQGDGIRKAFLDHHGTDVLTEIARAAGLEASPHRDRVLVVADELSAQLREDIAAQTYSPVAITTWSELSQFTVGSENEAGDFDILLPLSSSRRYSPFYAADHVAAFRYQGAPVTTKLQGSVEETDHAAHQHRSEVVDLSLSAWWRPSPGALESPEALLAGNAEGRVYAIDHLGHRAPSSRRVIDDSVGSNFADAQREFAATAEREGLELAVVVPIYNNGDHLRHKAFASLRRSEMFDRMHILLINDGSTDASTIDTIEELAHRYPNVSAFHHAAGGSGSASRPRNTGLALSSTEFVTYLDPDDEELDDGYMELLETLRAAPEADFALGTMAVWSHRYSVLDYHAWFLPGVEHRDGLNWPNPGTLKTLNFRPASIEALVARTEWLKSLGLVQPVGAVGQDTYFFQQMMYYAKAYAPVYRPVYTYYGAVDTSIVNVVSPKYFRKYLILELARAQWLREVGLLQDYLEQRFEAFFVTWYLEKYEKVQEQDKAESAEVLHQIADAYGPIQWTHPRAKAFFHKHPSGDSSSAS